MGRRKILYDDKKCMICEKMFSVKNKRQSEIKKACSKECSIKLGKINSLIKANCKICNKEVMTNKSSAKSETGVYCSDECRKYRYSCTCTFCKKEFNSKKSDTKYCSQKCKTAGMKSNLINVSCDECGIKFSRPSFAVNSSKNIFCNTKCRNRFFSRENPSRYGTRWTRIREKRVKMDDYTCQVCKKRKIGKYELHVHHVIPKDQFESIDKANEMSNLITLCKECHINHHAKNES